MHGVSDREFLDFVRSKITGGPELETELYFV